jgi:penicillin-binding protein 1B
MKEKIGTIFEKINNYWTKTVDFLIEKKIIKISRISYNVMWNLFLIFAVLAVIGFTFATGVGAGYFASLVKDEPIRSYESMKKDIYNYEETSNIYFANNIYLDKLRSEKEREEISIEDISDYVIKAVIATEDAEFWRHNGVVPKAIMRAIFQEATNSSVKTGGSTLTQQLIKNQILTNQVSFDRKAKEIVLALRLERFFDKDQILEAYLNVVDFGRNSSGRQIAGIQAAAKGIFGVDASELSLPQAAYIAGLPQSPFGYTPFTSNATVKESLEPSLNRMKTVLSRMLEAEFITQEEYEAALAYDIRANLLPPQPGSIERYPYLTFEIERRAKEKVAIYLANKDGIDKETLLSDDTLFESYEIQADREMRRSGYNIYTTIDKSIYDAMNKVVENDDLFGSDKPQTLLKENPETGELEEVIVIEPEDVGAMLIDNNTGAIISFVGGRDHSRLALNNATQSDRSPGSTIKPVLGYAPAMEEGKIQPGSVILDAPLGLSYPQYDPEEWDPQNWNKIFHGLVTAREALNMSWNIPAIKSYLTIDPFEAGDYLVKMGFSGDTRWQPGQGTYPSMSIGSIDVTLEEITNSYTTFANNGNFIDSYIIEKIVSKEGEVIFEHEVEEVEVFSPQTAYLTIDMLRSIVSDGLSRRILTTLDFKSDWGAKSGTTQHTHDSLFIGLNPNVTLGVRIGYETPKKIDSGHAARSQIIWSELANAAYAVNPELMDPEESFKMPGGIVRRSYCAASGLLPSDLCHELGLVETDIFNINHVPTNTDNSLLRGKVVYANGKTYFPLESTPVDMIDEAVYFNTENYNEEEIPYILPKNRYSNEILDKWKAIKIVSTELLIENGKVPNALAGVAKNQENQLTWHKHIEEDVIGYRIYRAENHSEKYELIASVLNNQDLVAPLQQGDYSYFVTAVDIAGNESNPSNKVPTGNYSSENGIPGDSGEPEDPQNPDDPNNPDDPDNPDDSDDLSNPLDPLDPLTPPEDPPGDESDPSEQN